MSYCVAGFRKQWRSVAAFTGFLVLFYAIAGYLFSASYIGENRRWRGINRGPEAFGLRSETVSLRSQDGVALRGWWLPAEGTSRACMVIAHGVDHTRQVMLPRASFLVRGGYDVLAIDLRGHGESAAQYASPGYLEARDILGAVHYIRGRRITQPIGVLGVSYGAVASLLAASQSNDIAAVVADGAYPSGKDVFENINHYFAHDHRSPLWMRSVFEIASFPGITRAIALVYYARTRVWLGRDLVSVLPAVSTIRIPVLLISGERDWIVPTEQTRRILAALPTEKKALIVIPGAVHDTTYSSAAGLYEKAVLTFLNQSVANPN